MVKLEKIKKLDFSCLDPFFIKSKLTKQLFILGFLILLITPITVYSTITVNGTTIQRNQIAKWLTKSLGATVTVGSDGKMAIANGGNAAATRLRNMIGAQTSVTIKVVENVASVAHGRWISSTADPKGPTTGTQEVDVGDLAALGNVINSYGITPDFWLMHEITEVFEGEKGINGTKLNYEPAHVKGIEAEKELMTAHNTELIFRRVVRREDGGFDGYAKIKRPDGTFVIVKFNLGQASLDGQWFKEEVPCKFEPTKLIAIADPDPYVHIFNYEYDLDHNYLNSIDTVNSRPTGVAFDASHNLYVSENLLSGQDEVRVFDPDFNLINTFSNPELINPEGIDIDQLTGDIFVAVEGKVLRFDKDRNLLGSYSISITPFRPSDVSIWRNYSTGGLYGDGTIYDIFVSDSATSQVYRFDVQNDMNQGTYVNAFGGGILDAPEGIQVDDWWTVWVASTGNNRIYSFTPSGNLERFGTQPFFIEDQTKKFCDMAKIRGEGLYVLDGTPGQGNLLLYNFNAELIKTYGSGKLQCPTSLAARFSTDLSNLVEIPDPGDDDPGDRQVPTLSEWGLIILALLLLTLGSVAIIRQKQAALVAANGSNLNLKTPLFNAEQFRRIALISIPFIFVAIAILSIIDGGVFIRNIIGTIISGLIISYLIHFVLMSEKLEE